MVFSRPKPVSIPDFIGTTESRFRWAARFFACLLVFAWTASTSVAQEPSTGSDADATVASPAPSDESSLPRRRGVEQETVDEITRVMERWKEALDSEEPDQVLKFFDTQALAQFAMDRGSLALDDQLRDAFLKHLRMAGKSIADQFVASLSQQDFQIVEVSADQCESLKVVIMVWDEDEETTSPLYWWWKKNPAGWQIVDMEDLGNALRLSTVMGLGMEAAKDQQDWFKPTQAVLGALENEMVDYEVFENGLDELLDCESPKEIRVFALILDIGRQMEEFAWEMAESRLSELKKLDPENAVQYRMLAELRIEQEEYEEALEALEVYTKQLAWGTDTYEMAADCYYQLNQRAKAVELASKGLDLHANAWGCLSSLAVALPHSRKGEMDARFAKIDFDEGALATAVEWSVEQDDWAAANHLYRLLQKHHPDGDAVKELKHHFEN